MLNDAILEKIFSHPEMQKIPVGAQATAVHVFEEILEEAQEVKPDVRLSEFLSGADADESSEYVSGF